MLEHHKQYVMWCFVITISQSGFINHRTYQHVIKILPIDQTNQYGPFCPLRIGRSRTSITFKLCIQCHLTINKLKLINVVCEQMKLHVTQGMDDFWRICFLIDACTCIHVPKQRSTVSISLIEYVPGARYPNDLCDVSFA